MEILGKMEDFGDLRIEGVRDLREGKGSELVFESTDKGVKDL